METAGTLDLEHISLFPEKTFNNRTNGLRRDLAQALKDLSRESFVSRVDVSLRVQPSPHATNGKYGRPRREPAYQYQPMELYISSQEIPGLLSILRFGIL